MKSNYLIYLLLLTSILFRSNILNLINNIGNNLFLSNDNLEVNILQNENQYLLEEYNNLLKFQNNIKIESDYVITNIIKNSYGLNNLIINGGNYRVGDEVISNDGLVGIISNVGEYTSELKYIYNTNLVVKVGDETGKIVNHDQNHNLIIKEISNYNSIKLNDLVYSVNGTYIGKIIKIKYDILDNYLTVKTSSLNNLNYVAVISR